MRWWMWLTSALMADLVRTASPSSPDYDAEQLPKDRQIAVYLRDTETKSLELRTEHSGAQLSLTVSPCTSSLRWSVLYTPSNISNKALHLLGEFSGGETESFTLKSSPSGLYVLKLQSTSGPGAASVVASGEVTPVATKVRLRRARRRRVSASWDPSPVDPHATRYCLVVSSARAYTSLCAARAAAAPPPAPRPHAALRAQFYDEPTANNLYPNVKYGRSSRARDEEPLIACVGARTHHVIDNLDATKSYHVSVFGVSPSRRGGVLVSHGVLPPHAPRARSLREGRPRSAELRATDSRAIFNFRPTLDGANSGSAWFGVTSCGGSVNVEISFRGRLLLRATGIESFTRLHVPGPGKIAKNSASRKNTPALAEMSAEMSASMAAMSVSTESLEERPRYLIKVTGNSEQHIKLEMVASSRSRALGAPSLPRGVLGGAGGGAVRELRALRSCRALVVGWLPARDHDGRTIRYCVIAREASESGSSPDYCPLDDSFEDGHFQRMICRDVEQASGERQVLTQRIGSLQPDRKYSITVTAARLGGSLSIAEGEGQGERKEERARAGRPVAYRSLLARTLLSCNYEE